MLEDLMELKPLQLFINSLSHNFQLLLMIFRILPLVVSAIMQPVCEVLNTRLEQPNNTKQATSNDHE